MFNFFSGFSHYKLLFMVELLAAMAISMGKLRRKEFFFGRVVLSAGLLMLATYLFPIPWYNSLYASFLFLSLFVFAILAACFCFDEPIYHILFCSITAYTTQHIAYETFNFLLTIGGLANYGDMYSETAPPNAYALALLIYVLSYCMVYWIIWIIMSFCLHGDDNELDIGDKWTKLALAFVIVLVDVVLNAILVYGTKEKGLPSAVIIVVYLQSVLNCSLALAVHFALLWHEREKREVARVKELWNADRAMYEHFQENVDAINIKCHDLKFRISELRHRAGKEEDNRLKEIEDAIGIYDSQVKTGNPVLDTILAEWSLQCECEHIRFICLADGPSLGFMSPDNLFTLLGNALSNAIEAVKKIDSEEMKLIHLHISRRNQMAFIHVDNYCEEEEELKLRDGYPETTKTDKENHGYGLRSMRMMSERLGGGLEYHRSDGLFHLNIFLPIPKEARSPEGLPPASMASSELSA